MANEPKLKKVDWDSLSEKGKNDLEITEWLDEKYSNIKNKLFNDNKKITLKEVETEILHFLNGYDLTKKDSTTRKNKFLKKVNELIHYHEKKVLAVFTLDAVQLYKIIEAIEAFIDEIEINVEENNIRITCMDPSRIMLMEARFFPQYYQHFKNGKIGLNVDDLAMILQTSTPEKAMTTILIGEENVFTSIYSHAYKSTIEDIIRLLDIDMEEIPIENLLKIQYPFRFQINQEQYAHIIKKIEVLSEIVNVKITTDLLKCSGVGQIGNRDIYFKKNMIKEIQLRNIDVDDEFKKDPHAEGAFSLTFLKSFQKMVNQLAKDHHAKCYVQTGHPLKIKLKIPLHDYTKKQDFGVFKIVFWLAFRAEEGDDDDEEVNEAFENEL